MSDYIVAIDLGTSHITGIVGKKKMNGKFSIVACKSVETETCIHRGIIYDSDDTATCIENILKNLESNLQGAHIDKVYVGVGGQSLHTIDHIESMNIAEGVAVKEEDIKALKEQCEKYKPNLKDVLSIAHVVYMINGQKHTKPVDKMGKLLEAHYKIVVGRSSIRQRITKSIERIPGKQLAGIIVSPLALADAVLSPRDKELGCALVDFGAGVTSVSIFKDGDLQHLIVIPLGGNLITRDVSSLQLTMEEAEKLKIEHGCAILQNEEENKVIQIEIEGAEREIKLNDLNMIIEGRAREIVENVNACISGVIDPKKLGTGIVLAGRGADLTDLSELLKDKCEVKKVRVSPIQDGWVEDADEMLGNPLYMMAISLMLKGTESCVSSAITKDKGDKKVITPDITGATGETKTVNTQEPVVTPTPKKSIFRNRVIKIFDAKEVKKTPFVTELFNEE